MTTSVEALIAVDPSCVRLSEEPNQKFSQECGLFSFEKAQDASLRVEVLR
jgi:hypothetical protein